jgi:hypothetical protein
LLPVHGVLRFVRLRCCFSGSKLNADKTGFQHHRRFFHDVFQQKNGDKSTRQLFCVMSRNNEDEMKNTVAVRKGECEGKSAR